MESTQNGIRRAGGLSPAHTDHKELRRERSVERSALLFQRTKVLRFLCISVMEFSLPMLLE